MRLLTPLTPVVPRRWPLNLAPIGHDQGTPVWVCARPDLAVQFTAGRVGVCVFVRVVTQFVAQRPAARAVTPPRFAGHAHCA
jgi:hypothetical protein